MTCIQACVRVLGVSPIAIQRETEQALQSTASYKTTSSCFLLSKPTWPDKNIHVEHWAWLSTNIPLGPPRTGREKKWVDQYPLKLYPYFHSMADTCACISENGATVDSSNNDICNWLKHRGEALHRMNVEYAVYPRVLHPVKICVGGYGIHPIFSIGRCSKVVNLWDTPVSESALSALRPCLVLGCKILGYHIRCRM
jgi:hypothetical protein